MTTSQPQQVVNPFVRLIHALIDLYAFSTLLVLISHYTIGERWNVVAIANNLLHLLLLTVPIGLLIAVLVRRWSAIGIMLFPLGLGIFHYAPMFIPTAPTPFSGQPVTILSYNLLARYTTDELQDAMRIIREANADIVLLQEVGISAEEAVEQLSDTYPHIALHPKEEATQGQGILSRYPITEDEYIQSDLNIFLGHQRVMINIEGTDVVIYNVHPVHPGMTGLDVSVRSADLNTVYERVRKEPDDIPVLVGGDMNATPFTRDYRAIRQLGFDDAFYDVGEGLGFTFPATRPLQVLRLDYLFYDAQWQALNAQVIQQHGGSDHFPLLVQLALLNLE